MLLWTNGALEGQFPPDVWKTDLSRKSINLSELKPDGPPKDGIPSIDRPQFVDIRQVSKWLHPKEPVLVVEHGGEIRGYPFQILLWHELVNAKSATRYEFGDRDVPRCPRRRHRLERAVTISAEG